MRKKKKTFFIKKKFDFRKEIKLKCDCCAKVEDTALVRSTEDGTEEAEIEIFRAPKREGEEIRPVGEDIALGEVVLRLG